MYADRTWEGTENGVQPVFQSRAWIGKKMAKTRDALGGYPTTPAAFRNAIASARAVDAGAVNSLLYEKWGAPLSIAVDDKHPLPETVPMPDEQHWQAALDALSAEAAFWMRESEEAGK